MVKSQIIPKKERFMYYRLLLNALQFDAGQHFIRNVVNPDTGKVCDIFISTGFCTMFEVLSTTTIDNKIFNDNTNTYLYLKELCPELWKHRTNNRERPLFWYEDLKERIEALQNILKIK